MNICTGFSGGISGKESACQCRRYKRCRFVPWVSKIPWRRAGNPLQYSYLENPMDRGTWRATVHRVTKSLTQLKRLSKHTYVQRPGCSFLFVVWLVCSFAQHWNPFLVFGELSTIWILDGADLIFFTEVMKARYLLSQSLVTARVCMHIWFRLNQSGTFSQNLE